MLQGVPTNLGSISGVSKRFHERSRKFQGCSKEFQRHALGVKEFPGAFQVLGVQGRLK